MSSPIDMAAIRALPIDERVELAHAILDTVTEEAENSPLTDAQKAELERRIAYADANPGAGTPWDVVKARLLARRGLCP